MESAPNKQHLTERCSSPTYYSSTDAILWIRCSRQHKKSEASKVGGLVTKTKRVTTQEYKMGDCYCTRCGAPLKSVPLTVYDCDACEEKQKFDAETGEPAQQLVCSACECHTRGHHWATKRHGWFRKAFNRCTRCGQTQPCVGLNY